MSEADFSWTNLEEPWERLVWARSRKFETAKAFAEALGMQENTYRNHEREPGRSRSAAITAEKAMRFAKPLKVRWEWLFHGISHGQPWPDSSIPTAPDKARDLVAKLPPEQQDDALEVIERMVRMAGR